MLLLLLVSIGMSWFATKMRAARRQRDAAAAIGKSGGWVAYYRESDEAIPSYTQPLPGPLWLRRLLGDDFFATVTDAFVTSDGDFKYLEQLDQLKQLRCGLDVTEAGLAHLKDLRQLRKLDLMGRRVAGVEFEHVAVLTQLEDLNLGGTDAGDAELERLQAMTRLRALGLAGTRITDAGLRYLEGLTRLETLSLSKTHIGNAGVEHLRGLARLRVLGLVETRITDAAIECLVGLKQLRFLELQGTNVSTEGVMTLDRALPGSDVRCSVPRTWELRKAQPGESSTSDLFGCP